VAKKNVNLFVFFKAVMRTVLATHFTGLLALFVILYPVLLWLCVSFLSYVACINIYVSLRRIRQQCVLLVLWRLQKFLQFWTSLSTETSSAEVIMLFW